MSENSGVQPDIPQDQLNRILPVVDELRAKLRQLADELPPDAASALIFEPATRENQ